MKLFFKDIISVSINSYTLDCKRSIKHIKIQFEHMKWFFKGIISV